MVQTNDSMLIVISNPSDIEQEVEIIHSLFENGLEYFHLRKPDKDELSYEEFLRSINPKYYKRIIIHSHFHFIKKYNLKGIHLSEAMMDEENIIEINKTAQKKRLSVSASVHSIEKVSRCKVFDYVFLSPLFDSISKKDYKGSIDLVEFKNKKTETKFPTKVIALGGIDSTNIRIPLTNGFNGAAILGGIWNNKNKEVEEFAKIQSIVSDL